MAGYENQTVRYRINPKQSRFVVQAEATGLLSVFGHNPAIAICGFGGDARFVPGTLERASLLMLVQADSLAVVGDASEKDRLEMERAMRDDVLEIERYPEIVFMSTSVSATETGQSQYSVRIGGMLSLHGVTRQSPIEAQVSFNGDHLRTHGEFKLKQSDYNIKQVSVAGGALKVKDELKLSFDLSAEKQE